MIDYTAHLSPQEIRRIERNEHGTIWLLLLLSVGILTLTAWAQA